MDRFQSCIQVDAPAQVCYDRWRNFENFPRFMKNVKQVTVEGTRKDGEHEKSHWVVNGPLGKSVEWDAVIDGDEPGRLISWHSVSRPENTIGVQGAVRFDEIEPGCTQVTCTIQYEAPGGSLGEFVADILSNPQHMVEEDLSNFKHLVEGTDVPAEWVGRHGQRDAYMASGVTGVSGVDAPADSPVARGAGIGTQGLSADQEIPNDLVQDPGYSGPYGLDTDDDFQGGTVMNESLDIEEIRGIEDEENPYLGQKGALYSEDLIEMRSDEDVLEEEDVFTESMDVYGEDLESFTEDLDEEIDPAAVTSRGSIEDYQDQKDSGGLVNQDRPIERGPQ